MERGKEKNSINVLLKVARSQKIRVRNKQNQPIKQPPYIHKDNIIFGSSSIVELSTIIKYYFSFLFHFFSLTPVDPAGPDCYQSGTKPCEST